MKKICYFGSYDPEYSRNRVIIKGLRLNGREVFLCHSNKPLLRRQLDLTESFLKIKDRISLIVVGFPGHYDLPLALLLGKMYKKKVVYDMFASKYETYVLDKKIISKLSPSAWFFYLWDKICLSLSDYVLIDTQAHGQLYQKLYKLTKRKLVLVYVGTDDGIFYPKKVKETNDVLFYGSYQPLQGAETIIESAKLMPKIKFLMIGEGQTKKNAQLLAKKYGLKNVKFIGWVSISKLASEIRRSKIILGIFGTSQKARSVIPNKVYDGLASGKLVITSKNAGIEELITNKRNAVLIKPEPYELKKTVEKFINDQETRERIAKSGYRLYSEKLKPKLVVKNLLKYG